MYAGVACVFAATLGATGAAHGQTASAADVQANLQAQINDLQRQLNALRETQAQPQPQGPQQAGTPAQQASGDPYLDAAHDVQKKIADRTGVTLTVGGFIEAAGIYRTKNETADISSSFNTGIPFPNAQNAHQSEFRGSARQSRLSLLAEGQINQTTDVKGYVEADFLGAGVTANSQESNSYNPRLRQAFAQVDRTDYGLHLVACQTWSLLTQDKKGIIARQENPPLTIDGQYVPGFNWTRNAEVRLVKDFDQKLWLGLSVESPEVANSPGATASGATGYNTGGPLMNSTATYSTDVAPDIIAKIAADPGWGHYELFGIGRWFHDNATQGSGATTHFQNYTVFGLGGGGNAILPVIPKMLDIQAMAMAGRGIGRYGSAQLPDVGFNAAGKVEPVDGVSALIGAIAHPDPTWDLYVYAGMEKAMRQHYVGGYGYSTVASLASCYQEGGACAAATSEVWQITPGVWKRFYDGPYGAIAAGLQQSFTRRQAFSDGSGGTKPHAIESVTMGSFRYYF